MNYVVESFRHAGMILNEDDFINQLTEITEVISGITDDDLINRHVSYGLHDEEKTPKSLSKAINELIKERLIALGWNEESNIFQNPDYTGETWRLDFAKDDISIEVGFNHSSVIAWNLIKPVLASELNHVEKAIQTQIGVVITATHAMQIAGGFDGAIGVFEKYLDYLPPLRNMLTTPLLIIGLEPPETFRLEEIQLRPRKKIGRIQMI